MAELVVDIVAFQDDWFDKYAQERVRLHAVVKDVAQDIEHIGSTSVPGLAAKPIIDIAMRLVTLQQVPELLDPLARFDYAYEGEYGLPGRYFFTKGEPRAFHLHVVDDTTNHWRRWIAFRDLLRRDPALCQAYQQLKCDLARKYRFDRAKYSDSKSAFIDAAVQGLI